MITYCYRERLDRRSWKDPGSAGKMVTVMYDGDFTLDWD